MAGPDPACRRPDVWNIGVFGSQLRADYSKSYSNIANKIKMDAPVKMTGHNLNMMKFTLTPVNNDTTDSTFNPMKASQ